MAKDDTPPSGGNDAGGKPPSDPPDKGKTLSDLLTDYEEKTAKASEPKGDDDGKSELEALRAEVQGLKEAEATRTYRLEMDDFIIPTVKGDLEVHSKLVESWINEQADDDPRLMKLWNERGARKKEFQETITAMKPEFQKYAEKEGMIAEPKKDPKKSRTAAVRTARESKPDKTGLDGVDLGAMSDQEFAMHKAEVFRLAESGELSG